MRFCATSRVYARCGAMGTARRNRRWTVVARQWETNPRAHRLTRGWKNATEPAVNPPPSSAFAGVKLREQWRGETSHRRSFCCRYPGNFFYGSRRFFVLYLGRTFLELCECWFMITNENARIIIANIARDKFKDCIVSVFLFLYGKFDMKLRTLIINLKNLDLWLINRTREFTKLIQKKFNPATIMEIWH